VEGRKIVSTFWGKAWYDNLESYRDYENRLERGRSYVRNGLVIDLQIAPYMVTAMVCGSSLYTVKVTINEVPKAQWKAICADCAGGAARRSRALTRSTSSRGSNGLGK